MSTILEQLALLYAFMLLGYIFGKKGIIAHEHSKVLSTIAVYIFCPAMYSKLFQPISPLNT